MHRRIGVIVAFVASLVSPLAEACETFSDDGHIFSFGRFELGADPAPLAAAAVKSDNCQEEPAYNYYDCLYTDIDGVEYLAFESGIIRKEIPDLAKYPSRVIGGIQAGDTVGTVLRKFRQLREELRFWTGFASRAKDSEALFLSPDRCLQLPNGTMFWFDLEFDENDKLVAVSASIESSI